MGRMGKAPEKQLKTVVIEAKTLSSAACNIIGKVITVKSSSDCRFEGMFYCFF